MILYRWKPSYAWLSGFDIRYQSSAYHINLYVFQELEIYINQKGKRCLNMNFLPSSVLTSTFILTAPSVKALHTFLLTSKNMNMDISHCYDS